MPTQYVKQKCVVCGRPVNQRRLKADAGSPPLCSEHAAEQASERFGKAMQELSHVTAQNAAMWLERSLGIRLSPAQIDELADALNKNDPKA
jgi:hypothetical protein